MALIVTMTFKNKLLKHYIGTHIDYRLGEAQRDTYTYI